MPLINILYFFCGNNFIKCSKLFIPHSRALHFDLGLKIILILEGSIMAFYSYFSSVIFVKPYNFGIKSKEILVLMFKKFNSLIFN